MMENCEPIACPKIGQDVTFPKPNSEHYGKYGKLLAVYRNSAWVELRNWPGPNLDIIIPLEHIEPKDWPNEDRTHWECGLHCKHCWAGTGGKFHEDNEEIMVKIALPRKYVPADLKYRQELGDRVARILKDCAIAAFREDAKTSGLQMDLYAGPIIDYVNEYLESRADKESERENNRSAMD